MKTKQGTLKDFGHIEAHLERLVREAYARRHDAYGRYWLKRHIQELRDYRKFMKWWETVKHRYRQTDAVQMEIPFDTDTPNAVEN